MGKKVTIGTVAEKAGVSEATISYILSGKRKISKDVTQKVLKIIEEVGYKPSVLARNLASNKTWTIGLYGPTAENIEKDLFFNGILSGILKTILEKKYQIHLYSDHLKKEDKKHPDLSMTQPIDGAIIMNPRINDVYLEHLESQDIPYVIIGTPPEGKDAFYVDTDQIAGIYNAMMCLFNKNHEKIILINSPLGFIQSKQREQGYKLAYKESGYLINENLIYNINEFTEEEGYSICKKIFRDKIDFTGMIICNDLVSIGVLKYLKEKKISIPSKLSLISSGNTLISRIYSPSITSIDLNSIEMGVNAGNLLIDIIEKNRIQPTHTIIPVKIIERETT